MFRKLSKLGSSSKKEETPAASSSTTATPAVAPLQEELNQTDAALDPTTGAHPAVLDEARDVDNEASTPISPAIVAPTLVDANNNGIDDRTEEKREHEPRLDEQAEQHEAHSAAAPAGGLRVDSSPVTPYDGPVKDDGMMSGFVPVPVSPVGGAHNTGYPAEKTEYETPAPVTNAAGIQDDGMMNNFVPVPTHVPSSSQERETEQPQPTSAETVTERFPSDEERERLSASQGAALAGGAGLAGVGAFAATQHHPAGTNETATFDHALPPATTVTPGLIHHHQTVTESGPIDHTRPSAVDGHPVPVDGAGAPVPVPASVAGLARGGAVGGGSGSISRRDLKKIEKAEHKDNKSLAKIMKSEAKHEAAVLEAAIKELARMQTTVKDAAKLEAKSARSRDEMIKVEQRTNAKFLEVKAVHDKAVAELKAKEEEHEINQRQTETLTNQVAEQTRKIEELRAAKARDDRERAEKLAAMK